MKALVLCLIDWLEQEPSSLEARSALLALAKETLKRVDSPDPDQRKFDAQAIAAACDRAEQNNYEAAKRWLTRADVPSYLAARDQGLGEFFRTRGLGQVITLQRSDTTGRHRTLWFLSAMDLSETTASEEGGASSLDPAESICSAETPQVPISLIYEFTPPGRVKLSLLGRMLLSSNGQVVTRSRMGLVWASFPLLGALVLIALIASVWTMSLISRPVFTSDLVILVMALGFSWVVWRIFLRPFIWLLEDRIAPASELLAGWSEEPCQLEMARDAEHRYIRLVRYGGICPVCAGKIELRYGQGGQGRRLFGCCSEVPQEHRFSFDRVTRRGVMSLP